MVVSAGFVPVAGLLGLPLPPVGCCPVPDSAGLAQRGVLSICMVRTNGGRIASTEGSWVEVMRGFSGGRGSRATANVVGVTALGAWVESVCHAIRAVLGVCVRSLLLLCDLNVQTAVDSFICSFFWGDC